MNDIPQDAILIRFIFSSKHFARGNQTVKFRVFMPPQVSKEPPTYSPNLSVYRISEISDSEVWEIGQEHVQTEDRLIRITIGVNLRKELVCSRAIHCASYIQRKEAQ